MFVFLFVFFANEKAVVVCKVFVIAKWLSKIVTMTSYVLHSILILTTPCLFSKQLTLSKCPRVHPVSVKRRFVNWSRRQEEVDSFQFTNVSWDGTKIGSLNLLNLLSNFLNVKCITLIFWYLGLLLSQLKRHWLIFSTRF